MRDVLNHLTIYRKKISNTVEIKIIRTEYVRIPLDVGDLLKKLQFSKHIAIHQDYLFIGHRGIRLPPAKEHINSHIDS